MDANARIEVTLIESRGGTCSHLRDYSGAAVHPGAKSHYRRQDLDSLMGPWIVHLSSSLFLKATYSLMGSRPHPPFHEWTSTLHKCVGKD
ncbi:hypothetical protein BHM03_00031994 [Ensete ventricosum]|nr:hypothetical protein BHM03_00031994 [Ensete ventricosum]